MTKSDIGDRPASGLDFTREARENHAECLTFFELQSAAGDRVAHLVPSVFEPGSEGRKAYISAPQLMA